MGVLALPWELEQTLPQQESIQLWGPPWGLAEEFTVLS